MACMSAFNSRLSAPGIFPHHQQGIAGDAQAAHQHGRYGNQGIEQTAHGNGNADRIIKVGKGKILVDFFIDLAGKIQKVYYLGGFAPHQGDVGGFLAELAAGMDGYGKICLNQGRCIVDPVAHHGNAMSRLLEAANQS